MKEINLNKKVKNKSQYIKVIDTSFKELGVQTTQEQIDAQPTTDDFFSLYNQLFYEINERGENNSHEFLIKKSSEYIKFDEINEEIKALQGEITQLREDLLESQKRVIELETGINIGDLEQ